MKVLPVFANGERVHVGFWRRSWAMMIDVVLLLPLALLFSYMQTISISLAMASVILSQTFHLCYMSYFHYKFGATMGKMIAGIRVVNCDGSPINLMQSFVRIIPYCIMAVVTINVHVMALSELDADQYLTASWLGRGQQTAYFIPDWHVIFSISATVWIALDGLTLIFNKRKRSLHDIMAGTVVIKAKYAGCDIDSLESA